jgi:hypothetical protein
MDKDILYGFFNGTASQDEEIMVREWLEVSAQNRRALLKERRLFDMLFYYKYPVFMRQRYKIRCVYPTFLMIVFMINNELIWF